MAAIELSKRDIRALLPARPQSAHKGTFGHLLVLAGSRGFTGAARLCGLAAARSGVGLVTLGVPRTLADIVAAGVSELMTLPLPAGRTEAFSAEALRPALAFAAKMSAVALGPGISQNAGTKSFVGEFVAKCPAPLVVDADGLNTLAGRLAPLRARKSPTILTPHPGEMARLCGATTGDVQANREKIASEFAQKHKCVLALKGNRSVIAGPGGELFVNPTGNSGMATGGTGDALTGILGALLAQGVPALDAARLGVYAHGLAGDFAAAEKTERAMIAGDLIEKLPATWRYIEGGYDA